MQTCYLLNFNNYYNREYKKLYDLNDYLDYMKYSWTNVNFNPGDGITTSIPVNYDGEVNYLSLTDNTVPGTVGEEVIVSRWFIIESKFTRMGQRVLTLRRDILVDYSSMATATVFAERGYVPNTSSLIYNSEGNSYNQIKKSEKLIKDESESAWLVGYLAPNVFDSGNVTIQGSNTSVQYDYSFATLDEMNLAFPGVGLIPTTLFYNFGSIDLRFLSLAEGNQTYMWRVDFPNDMINYETTSVPAADATMIIRQANLPEVEGLLTDNFLTPTVANIISDKLVLDYSSVSRESVTKIINNRDVIARVGTASGGYTYYQLSVGTAQSSIQKHEIRSTTATNTFEYLTNQMSQLGTAGVATGTPDRYFLECIESYFSCYWRNIPVTANTIELKTTTAKVDSSPYYCFAIPYHSVRVIKGNETIITDPRESLLLARNIATQLGSFCYDVQLLPYFPLQSYIDSMGRIDTTTMPEGTVAVLKSADEVARTFLFWITKPNFSFAVPDTIDYSSEPKIQNETQFCRLNSPNFSASFDKKKKKNKGVTYWQVDCSYKPYQPYIHVAPNWGGLYGSDFNDARGLICTGDFSIDLMTDKWQEYQIQNKNYNEIFNRQIQSLDLQQSIAKRQDIFGAVAGSLSGAMSGATTGALAGGLPGAIGGGITGLGISAVGGVMDIIDNQKLRDDARSSQFDMFNYQLGNVKALPNTLTKVSTYNINNKIYPFYEIYEATSEEIGALRQRLKWRGYNLGIIGQLSDFQVEGKYFKGKIIRLEEVHDVSLGDNHLLENYNSELQQGVYWTKL